MKIAVDAMGGDHAPKVVIDGLLRARDEYPDLEFIGLRG
jgi:glycerol-3-phosphate acyltransferase PlsX